jgi:TRAP-type C4-dicarboxylate transport system permease small subunit
MERFFRWSLTILITTVAIMMFVQVVTRYILQIPVMGLEELLVYCALWLYVLGSVNASREDTQIKANVLDVFVKTARAKLKIRIVADVLSLVTSLWLTWWAWDYLRYAFRTWKLSPTLYVPLFWAECSLFVGLVLMSAYVSFYLARHVRQLLLRRAAQGV